MDGEARYTLGVAGVVSDAAGQVLLIKTEQAGWELPGGRVEQGEDLIAALAREVREETACEVAVGRLVSLSTGPSGLVLFTFVCRHAGGEPRASDDSLDARWFARDAALAAVTHPAERARLGDGLAGAEGITYRVYRLGAAGGAEQHARHTI